MAVYVLRLSHRIARDKRISTHCGLVARAFGANGIFYSGEKDESFEKSVRTAVNEWGGDFGITHVKKWKNFIQDFKGKSVHLTMYGMPVQKTIDKIKKYVKGKNDILVIVGGEKVPGEVYHLSDSNVSVTSQPHSEVAALAIFLHEYFQGTEMAKRFNNAKRKVVPQERGKKVIQS